MKIFSLELYNFRTLKPMITNFNFLESVKISLFFFPVYKVIRKRYRVISKDSAKRL